MTPYILYYQKSGVLLCKGMSTINSIKSIASNIRQHPTEPKLPRQASPEGLQSAGRRIGTPRALGSSGVQRSKAQVCQR